MHKGKPVFQAKPHCIRCAQVKGEKCFPCPFWGKTLWFFQLEASSRAWLSCSSFQAGISCRPHGVLGNWVGVLDPKGKQEAARPSCLEEAGAEVSSSYLTSKGQNPLWTLPSLHFKGLLTQQMQMRWPAANFTLCLIHPRARWEGFLMSRSSRHINSRSWSCVLHAETFSGKSRRVSCKSGHPADSPKGFLRRSKSR